MRVSSRVASGRTATARRSGETGLLAPVEQRPQHYARGGDDSVEELAAIAQAYYAESEGSRATFLLVDSRHPQLQADAEAAKWLSGLSVPYRIVATKIDKLKRNERAKNLKTLQNTLGMPALPVSAANGEGMDELWRTIARLARSAE